MLSVNATSEWSTEDFINYSQWFQSDIQWECRLVSENPPPPNLLAQKGPHTSPYVRPQHPHSLLVEINIFLQMDSNQNYLTKKTCLIFFKIGKIQRELKWSVGSKVVGICVQPLCTTPRSLDAWGTDAPDGPSSPGSWELAEVWKVVWPLAS